MSVKIRNADMLICIQHLYGLAFGSWQSAAVVYALMPHGALLQVRQVLRHEHVVFSCYTLFVSVVPFWVPLSV